MTTKAGVRENWANVAVEVYGLFWRLRGRLPGAQWSKAQGYGSGHPSADDRSDQETPPPIELHNREYHTTAGFHLEALRSRRVRRPSKSCRISGRNQETIPEPRG